MYYECGITPSAYYHLDLLKNDHRIVLIGDTSDAASRQALAKFSEGHLNAFTVQFHSRVEDSLVPYVHNHVAEHGSLQGMCSLNGNLYTCLALCRTKIASGVFPPGLKKKLQDAGVTDLATGPGTPGYAANAKDNTFEARFAHVQKFKEMHGHCNIPNKDRDFGTVSTTLRQQYRIANRTGTKSAEKCGFFALKPDQIASLLEIGFVFSPRSGVRKDAAMYTVSTPDGKKSLGMTLAEAGKYAMKTFGGGRSFNAWKFGISHAMKKTSRQGYFLAKSSCLWKRMT